MQRPAPVARTAQDEALVRAVRERRRERPLPKLVQRPDGQTAPDSSDLTLWTVMLQRALGAESGQAALRTLVQLSLMHGCVEAEGAGALDVNADIAAIAGIEPRDQLESLLAVQMVALHNLGMHSLAQATHPRQTVDGQELSAARGVRLLRAFREHVEALQRYRGKGQQRVTVEHVHVHQGGQAIVGVGAVQVPERRTLASGQGGGDAGET